MARPTEPKLRKMRQDLDKIQEKLTKMRLDASTMIGNPKGSDGQVCRDIRESLEVLATAINGLNTVNNLLEGPERVLRGRLSGR